MLIPLVSLLLGATLGFRMDYYSLALYHVEYRLSECVVRGEKDEMIIEI